METKKDNQFRSKMIPTENKGFTEPMRQGVNLREINAEIDNIDCIKFKKKDLRKDLVLVFSH